MKIEMMDTMDAPPSYRYAYDAEGFYVGIVKAQKHPLREGEYLTPANSCCVRPTFQEGFRPRWDGSVWNLENTSLKKVVASSVPENVIQAKRDEMFEHLKKNLEGVLVSEVRTMIDERIEESFSLFSKLVADSSRTFLNLAKEEKISTDMRFKNLEDSFFNRIQQMINELDMKKSEIQTMLEEMSALSSNVEMQSVKQKSFFGKVVDYFRSKEPALVEPEIKSGDV